MPVVFSGTNRPVKKFTACLKSEEISGKLKNILNINNGDSMVTEINNITTVTEINNITMVAEINNILTFVATKSKIKGTRKNPVNDKTNTSWYDKECFDMKAKIKATAKLS